MKKYGTDHFTCDRAKIISENDHFLKIRAAITAVGVYPYPDGRAFKSRRALLAATPFVRSAKLTIKEHPATMVIMNQKDIVGYCEKPYFERDRLWAVMVYNKRRTPKQYIDALHDPNLIADVSIGFYYTYVPIPGEYQGKAYDYRMEDIVIDHVASFVPKGRCTYPTCGIGVDQTMKTLFQTDKVVKRGNQWCIIHTHGAKAGTLIKGSCHANKSETEAMHRAIEASKMRAGRNMIYDVLIYGSQDKRPPKAWMDNCKRKAEGFADDPGAFCGWVYYNGPEALKRSFGSSSVQKINGGKKRMSEETGEGLVTTPEDFEKCVKQRLEEYPEMSREEAEALCKAVTKPEDEPIPPGGTLTDQEQTEYQKCIVKYTSEPENLSLEEAIAKCKEEGHVKADQDAAFENCVTRKKEEGMTQEEAEKECRVEHPVAEGAQETYESCVTRLTKGGMAQEEAEKQCRELHPVSEEDQDVDFENCVTRLMTEGKTRVEAEKQCRIEHPVTDQEEEPTPLEKCIDMKTEEGMTHEEATEWCEAELAGEHETPEDLVATSQKLLKLKAERDTLRQIEARRKR